LTEAIAVKDLFFTYPDGLDALCGANMAIQTGETVALIGPNGAGKSTLLYHLNGLLHSHSGEVRIMGQAVHHKNLKTIRRYIGMVFQNPDDQLFCPTVFDDVAFGPLNLGMKNDEVSCAVTQALDAVDMKDYEKRSSHHLSLGEKRRVAIATVLAMSPSVLILDEPSANLDPDGKWKLVKLLRSLRQTKLIVTHDFDIVHALCTRVIIMDAGRMVASGETREILDNKALLATHRLAIPEDELCNLNT